ncbi:MAG: hypothetical protein BJ554DRAFT_862 [Olpidium bornovanus]|uniref:Uncharacterized protein n=1 Tax=Olpidium bornovanus TaxID=278681 RepID=A0A8H8DI89_9FUNG|nr:MAG: hypothetical protein BJ554DRAFT_862 [Olpidium bornovanus]
MSVKQQARFAHRSLARNDFESLLLNIGASSKYAANFCASMVALEMRSFRSGRNLGPFVRFVYNEYGIASQVRFRQELPEQHAVGHILDDRLVRGHVLKANRVPDVVSQLASDLLCHPGGD